MVAFVITLGNNILHCVSVVMTMSLMVLRKQVLNDSETWYGILQTASGLAVPESVLAASVSLLHLLKQIHHRPGHNTIISVTCKSGFW